MKTNSDLPKVASPQIAVSDQGSMVLFTPMTDTAAEWMKQNLQTEAWQWLGASLAVDHRPARQLVGIMQAEGFV